MTQWPDPNKPGYPVNREKTGVHLWADDELQNTWGLNWSSHHQQWFSYACGTIAPEMLVELKWRYLGPCIPYADAFTAGARAAREQAVEWCRESAAECEVFEKRIYGKKYFRQEQVADAIQSLPLPNAAPDNSANTVENLSATGEMTDTEIKGVDTQVTTGAAINGQINKQNPEWLFYEYDESTFCFGRWAKNKTRDPYIRADLVVAEIQRRRAEKTPDFLGLWGLVDRLGQLAAEYRVRPADSEEQKSYFEGRAESYRQDAQIIEQELTKMGVKRK